MDTHQLKTDVVNFAGKATLLLAVTGTVGVTLGGSCVLGVHMASKALGAREYQRVDREHKEVESPEREEPKDPELEAAELKLKHARDLMKQCRELEAMMADDASSAASATSARNRTRVQFPRLNAAPKSQQQPQQHRSWTFKNAQGEIVNVDGDADLRNLTPEQRKQLEDYVDMMREINEQKNGKQVPKTFTEA